MLATGTRFGPYEIQSALGHGGMGEVYRARDTRLDRTVALKVLPDERAHDAHFRERFEREARAVSSLNHPNICVLHDVGSEGGICYLVMECVEGESLASRLERGPLAAPEALRCAIEIASALEAAHRRGVVHRDLKPANVMITKSGAKLLDFGLAKMQSMGAAADHTATLTVTAEGSLVGTFQYMSPEQLEGKEADARSDIFAFGATLYEMLTGQRAFSGQSQASLIGAIMNTQPAAIPGPLDRVVRQCLAKSPDDRWHCAHDLAGELRWIQESGGEIAAAAPRKRAAALPWIAAAVCGVAALALAVALLRQEKPPAPRAVRFEVMPPEGVRLANFTRPMVSPDGQSVAFAGADGEQMQVYLHSLTTGATHAVPRSQGGSIAIWSSDSQSLLTRASGGGAQTLLDLNGAPPQTFPLQFNGNNSAWGPRGILNVDGNELQLLAADGSAVRTLKRDPKGSFSFPSWLPDGRRLLYNQPVSGGAGNTTYLIHALAEDGKEDRTLGKVVGGPAVYASSGYIVFVRAGVLMAQAVDWKRLELEGGPLPVTDHIGSLTNNNFGAFTVSNNGVLAFRSGANQSDTRLVWVDRSGHPLQTVGGPADYTSPSLSPDGARLAVGVRDPNTQTRDIWVFDLARNGSSRLTFDPGDDMNPSWSPDDSRIAFTSDRRGVRTLYLKNSSGSGEDELLLASTAATHVEDWSRDGRWIAFNRGIPARALGVFSLETRKATMLLESRFTVDQARFSPDGRWLAYRSLETGRAEVYIRPFVANAPTGLEGKWQISTGGGEEPAWRADGKELFFVSPDMKVTAVDIAEKNGAIVSGIPHPLFGVRVGAPVRNRWLAAPDGQRFLVAEAPEPKPVTSFTVIVNWPSLLRK